MSMLNIGVSALLTSQNNLTTTSHNISNVNTEGYSRQRANQVSLDGDYSGSQWYGNGVKISTVERLYDNFLSSQSRFYTSQGAQQGSYLGYAKQVGNMLAADSLSISKGLSAFFNAVSAVANDPTLVSARQQMLSQAELLAKRFNTMDNRLNQLGAQVDTEITASVKEINSLAKGIAELNAAILEAEGSTQAMPNDLLDKRDQLINKLSTYVSVDVTKQSNGTVNISIGSGQSLVAGSSAQTLSAITVTTGGIARLGIGYGPNQVDVTAQVTGGRLGGAIAFRTEVIDTTRTELNRLAKSLVQGVNAVHNNASNANGAYDLDGNAGGNFFNPANITAATISVAITDPRDIAASSGTKAGKGNNENALALAKLQTDKTLVTVGAGTRSLSEHFSVIVSDVATRTQRAEISQQTQKALLKQTQQRLDAIAGVNLDEEAANLIKYQQAYQAASQVIVVSKKVFDSLLSVV